MIRLSILKFFVLVCLVRNNYAQEVVVGSGSCGSSQTQNMPVKYDNGTWNGGKNNSWSLMLFKGAELKQSGNISTIGFYPNCKNKNLDYLIVSRQRIYFKETLYDKITDVSKPDLTTYTLVFEGDVNWKRKTTFNTVRNDIVLDKSFNYNKIKNLLVYFENESGVNVEMWGSIPFLSTYHGTDRGVYALYNLSEKAKSTGNIEKSLPITYFKFSVAQPAIQLPNNQIVCAGDIFEFSGVSAMNYHTLFWSSSGSGSFEDNSILNPKYSASSADIKSGNIILKLTAEGGSGTVTKSVILTFKKKPIASIKRR